jgi:hypothetical protein
MEAAMMPVIRITERTWERMQRHAQPLVDTPDDIVNRGLDALENVATEPRKRTAATGRPRKVEAGQKLPQKEFRAPLLLTLDALGGGGSLDEVRKTIYPRVKAKLGEADHGVVATGEPRWWNAICWERYELVKEGYLRPDSPRGRWELSDEGRRKTRALASQ